MVVYGNYKKKLFFYIRSPNPDKPELKIEDCKLNIGGCRFAPSFFKWKEFLKYSIENIQSFQNSEKIIVQFFATKCTKITTKGLNTATDQKAGVALNE